ncbi:FkbM family methyltransferase [Phreatobacter sp. AB_2022a]|uniref:FkbM family methyltransferase n=1 Tax=Phreatobacter sp. AB_2022a TaxID=3003134 RepID=UPI0022875B0D|nr:FkbM family methyltransferase [Phreatobacter sp. AB_2022a]MCZ0733004.1 FkbM family methyltransferase [Phreatobacter sp. AB_2022a]
MISYAQNFEDVILSRALKHVVDGFYIDIGAQDPIIDSVSLTFYERGWRGIHVEPNHVYANALREARPHETVIQAAIGRKGGIIQFWEFPETGLSTGIAEIASQHRSDNRPSKSTDVPCISLADLLDTYGNRPVHWLKIDVEGMEADVIGSWAPSSIRPWIVVVESTKPNSQEPSFMAWEPALKELGYQFVYFDGLNRFYVNSEQEDLKTFFGAGPNLFDAFELSERSIFVRNVIAAHAARDQERTQEIARLANVADGMSRDVSVVDAALDRALGFLADLRGATKGVQGEAGQHPTSGSENRAEFHALLADLALERVGRPPECSEQLKLTLQKIADLVEIEVHNISSLSHRVQTAEWQVEAARQRSTADLGTIADLSGMLEQKTRELDLVSGQLSAVLASTSWRVSAPIRWTGRRVRCALRPLLEQLYTAARRFPALKPFAWSLVSTVPPLKRKLVHFAQARASAAPEQHEAKLTEAAGSAADAPAIPIRDVPLSLRARQIFTDLSRN